MKHRRTIFKVLCLLAAGATLNVAVAWGCALWLDPTTAEGEESSPGIRDQYWVHLRYVRPGVAAFSAAGETSPGFSETATPNAREFFPGWSQLQRQSDESLLLTKWRESRRSIASGWPALSLWYQTSRWLETSSDLDPLINENIQGGIAMPEASPMLRAANYQRALPLCPIWPGFAINTLFYAGVLWMLFAAPFALRRMIRRRRGRCALCAYPIGQSPICTECGAAVRATVAQG